MRRILLFFLALGLLLAACAPGNEAPSGTPGPKPGGSETEANPMTPATLTFHSFDGGGPRFTAVLSDPDLVSVEKQIEYSRPDHEELDGAAFSVRFILTGRNPGTGELRIEERSPIAGNYDRTYAVTVDPELRVTLEALTVTDLDAPEPLQPIPVLAIGVGNQVFYAALEDNPSAEALVERLEPEPIALDLRDYGGFEKVGALPWALPRGDEPITTAPGDVILYQGNQFSIYYGENTWELTRLARIDGVTGEELLAALAGEPVSVLLWIEWSE